MTVKGREATPEEAAYYGALVRNTNERIYREMQQLTRGEYPAAWLPVFDAYLEQVKEVTRDQEPADWPPEFADYAKRGHPLNGLRLRRIVQYWGANEPGRPADEIPLNGGMTPYNPEPGIRAAAAAAALQRYLDSIAPEDRQRYAETLGNLRAATWPVDAAKRRGIERRADGSLRSARRTGGRRNNVMDDMTRALFDYLEPLYRQLWKDAADAPAPLRGHIAALLSPVFGSIPDRKIRNAIGNR